MSKKIIVVGSSGVGRTTLAEQVAKHDSIHDVTICEDLEIKRDILEVDYLKDIPSTRGSNKTPKKKKRKKKGKKTHR